MGVLLVEQVRVLSLEENKINVGTQYYLTSAAWATIHSYGNITLQRDSLVVFKLDIVPHASDVSAFRLKIGSYYCWGKSGQTGALQTVTGIAYVPAGVHAVLVEGCCVSQISVANFQLGVAYLLDNTGYGLAAYASTVTLRVPTRNNLPCGVLKNAVFMVRCWAYTSGGQTNFENVGDAETNGVSLAVDGVQVNWTERNQDTGSIENASATYYGSLSVADSHTFAITKDNANTVVHICIYASPWLLAAVNNEIATLDFAQNRTLYVTLEPLNANPTKHCYIGKARAVSYGNATDYYNTDPNAAGIIKHSYTFQTENPSACFLYVSGVGGCVSQIGVDV